LPFNSTAAQRVDQGAPTTVVDKQLFAQCDSDDSDASEHPETEPEPQPEPEEGPAAWEIETARIRAEQAKKQAAKSEEEEEVAASATADRQAGSEGDYSDEEELDALLDDALMMGRALRAEMQRDFTKGNLSRKMLRQRASDARRASKRYHGSALDPVIDEARNDEQTLFRLIIEAEISTFIERELQEQDLTQLQRGGSSDDPSVSASPSRGGAQGTSSDWTRRGTFMKKKGRKLLKHQSRIATQMAPAKVVGETIATRVMAGELVEDENEEAMAAQSTAKADDSRWKRRLRVNRDKFA
jgi:hypothetical protein